MAWQQSVTVMSTISAFKCSTIDGSSLREGGKYANREIEKTDFVKIQSNSKLQDAKGLSRYSLRLHRF